MELINFSLDRDFIGVLLNEDYLDLHNNFEFAEFKEDTAQQIAEIYFTKSKGDWAAGVKLEHFKILFEEVTAVYNKEPDPDYPHEHVEQDQKTIDHIGFAEDGEDNMEGSIYTSPSAETPSLLFVFITGKAIKVTADKATLIPISSNSSGFPL